MRSKLEQAFDCTPEVLWDLFDDPAFERRLVEVTKVTRDVVELREEDGVRYRKLRCIPDRELPLFARKAMGVDKLSYDQESWLDRSKNEMRWSVSPAVLPGKVTVKGTTRIRKRGAGCVRVIDGNFDVRLPIVGRKMEELLIRNLEESYERAASLVREILAER